MPEAFSAKQLQALRRQPNRSHRQLHQAGNEVVWWQNLRIDALEIAKGLWEETRMKTFPTVAPTLQQQAPTDPPQTAVRQDASKLPNEAN